MEVLTLDQGNSSLSAGVFSGGRLVFSAAMDTWKFSDPGEYGQAVKRFFSENLGGRNFSRIGLCCSRPAVLEMLGRCAEVFSGARRIDISAALLPLSDVKVDETARHEVGADLIAAAQGAYCAYGGNCLIIDLGTATTLTYMSGDGTLEGVVICPGLKLSAEALSLKIPHLPAVSLEYPPHVLGGNTADCLKSGFMWGHTAMLAGFVEMIRKEKNAALKTVLCGGFSRRIFPQADFADYFEPDLLLKGIDILCSRAEG